MKLIMNSTQPFMRMSALVLFLLIGCSSIEISAGKKSFKHCDAIQHLIKTVAWGVVTVCSAYLIFEHANETLSQCQKLLKSLFALNIRGLQPILLKLLQEGCIIGGLIMLLRKAMISTMYNFEQL